MSQGNRNIHLVVLVHGLWGNVSHMEYISKQLKRLPNSKSELVVHVSSSNENYKTYDGIDVCGQRLYKEVENLINNYTTVVGSRVVQFSMIGYSLGGLIARYAVGMLYSNVEAFQNGEIKLMNFTTFCTPHVGVLAPGINTGVKLFNSLVPRCLGNSGKQMFLKDSDKLLHKMALPNSIFVKCLSNFAKLSLYSNCINDTRTAYWTSGISKNDPFFDLVSGDNNNNNNSKESRLDYKRFQYIENYEPVVLDNKKPLKILSCSVPSVDDESSVFDVLPMGNVNFVKYWCVKMFKWFTVLTNFIFLLIISPLWGLKSVTRGILENWKSYIRVNNHYKSTSFLELFNTSPVIASPPPLPPSLPSTNDDENNDSHDGINKAVTPDHETNNEHTCEETIEENFETGIDTFVNSVYEAIERVETKSASLVDTDCNDALQLSISIHDLETQSLEELSYKIRSSSNNTKQGSTPDEVLKILSNFKIEIKNKYQLQIIDNLNTHLKWHKFPILIRNTKSTHAASIVRHKDPFFNEGKVVISHYIEQVFETL